MRQKNNLVEFTQRLCSIQTENPPGREFAACVEFLENEMQLMGLSTQRIQVPFETVQKNLPPECWEYPRLNLIARWDRKAAKTLHFNSHFDVVPVSDDWKSDPFSPIVKGTRLIGRGTSDMKGCLAASVFAVKALMECGLESPWNIELSFTCDEEIGGECGAGYLTKQKLIRPDAVIVCEGGAGPNVMIGHRGVLWADVTVAGKAAHGSNPGAGTNAFEKGIELASRFQQYHQNCLSRTTAYPMDLAHSFHPSMTIGGVSGGGSKVNTIPDSFHFTIDRRLIPEERVADIKREFQSILKQASLDDPELKASIRYITGFDAAITDINSTISQRIQSAIESVYRKPANPRVFGAFTDLHFFLQYCQCPAVGYGVEGDGIHSSNEYLKIQSLVDTARVYAETALSMG